MRTFLGVMLALTCLGLAGCSHFGKKSAKKDAARPFLGSEPARSGGTTTSTGRGEVSGLVTSSRDPLPGANGVLAGRVLDRYYRHSSRVQIQVEDLQEVKSTDAKLQVQYESDEDGYFVIRELIVGHQYRLIARTKDNGKVLSGSTVARPPMPSLTIFVSEDNTSSATPPIQESTLPARPGKGDGASGSLDPPVKPKPDDSEGSKPGRERGTSSGTSQLPAAGQDPNISNVVEGFQRHPGPQDAIANIPNASSPKIKVPPPPPAWSPVTPQSGPPPQPQPHSAAPSVGVTPMVHIPSRPRVPSCALYGNQLTTFTLRDTNGQVWDFARDHKGKLVLVDFWFTGCRYCMPVMDNLKAMHAAYGRSGLEIIGIACEQGGPPQEQLAAVRSFAGPTRHNIPYRILMSEDSSCPVRSQFNAWKYPTVVLFDASGTMLWKCEGPREAQLEELRYLICQKLAVPYGPLKTR